MCNEWSVMNIVLMDFDIECIGEKIENGWDDFGIFDGMF